MILLTNGDSWTQGDSPAQTINWEATKTLDWYDVVPNFGDINLESEKETRIRYKFYDSDVWPKILGQELELKTWNAGRLGSDNYSILRRTINTVEWLEKTNQKDLFVIIGWTSMLRVPVFKVNEQTGDIVLHQSRPLSSEILDRYLYNKPPVYTDYFALTIYTLQQYLLSKDIKFLFFNAFDSFNNLGVNTYSKLILKQYWVNHDIHTAHFKDYIVDKFSLKSWKESKYFKTKHPTDEAHRVWGSFLGEYIKNNYEIN